MSRLWLGGPLLCYAVASTAPLTHGRDAGTGDVSDPVLATLTSPRSVCVLVGSGFTAEFEFAHSRRRPVRVFHVRGDCGWPGRRAEPVNLRWGLPVHGNEHRSQSPALLVSLLPESAERPFGPRGVDICMSGGTLQRRSFACAVGFCRDAVPGVGNRCYALNALRPRAPRPNEVSATVADVPSSFTLVSKGSHHGDVRFLRTTQRVAEMISQLLRIARFRHPVLRPQRLDSGSTSAFPSPGFPVMCERVSHEDLHAPLYRNCDHHNPECRRRHSSDHLTSTAISRRAGSQCFGDAQYSRGPAEIGPYRPLLHRCDGVLVRF